MPEIIIESLDHEGRGVARQDGKTLFVEGALPGERVTFSSYRRKPNYELATAGRIIKPSSLRIEPRCRHFGICGGCSMQHLDAPGQAAAKQRVLEDAFWHIGRLRPETVYPAIQGSAWAYRSRARLSVRLVPKKGGVLVGFHEKRSSYIADMDSCEVLPSAVSKLLPLLRRLVGALSVADQLPQIEVAVGDAVTVLVLRILQPLTPSDEAQLRRFAEEHGIQFWLQPGGPDSAHPFHPAEAPALGYALPDFDLQLRFRPNEFTQVNQGINRMLLRRAMHLLQPRPGERIGDLFCGLGNFTLPIARSGAYAFGVEGSQALVRRAEENAALNGLSGLVGFSVANLFEAKPELLAGWGRLDKWLIDPPREGAIELVKAIGEDGPQSIVYVSCSPATLARDAAVLVHEKGYRLRGAGIANMFPQTSHVESIALFEK
ncbi:MAG: 23S rRNA (uracil(1939)-C(5))-methyltransferase RlmD [Rhodocyclaceae bacterium]|jgi:23S rRNA (uracil1939-C5)-methyltransferase|nr:23S rRNA (uracil(1939)-C(5))-methyltransferase RlmD [Rhodocyclaceae bacterium]MBZ0145737.1 23S rRNA (uracil(1939)-C(5))-methyltransferase RlmD [Rhodocyclaceae bacterium]MCC6879351.1 23S rRNA (uracil(1939)-C(5))-methyltransferase RlmD [Rhodocyclaceae bacterium]